MDNSNMEALIRLKPTDSNSKILLLGMYGNMDESIIISDPFGEALETYDETFAAIQKAIRGFLLKISKTLYSMNS
jgi:protein-tyrosine-phosphatase